MQKSFQKQKDGSFELLLDDQNSGIFFHIPPECKIEDYNIVIVGQKLVSSSRAHFTLDNHPENMGRIKINSAAGMHFDNNINIKVGKQLEIGKNNNLVINSYSKTSLYFDELLVTNTNHDDKETTQKIDNSIFKSIVRLHNISKVSFSEINNTDISSNKEVEISNEFIKDQRIGDYEEFAKSRQARDSFDKDTSITEDLEVL